MIRVKRKHLLRTVLLLLCVFLLAVGGILCAILIPRGTTPGTTQNKYDKLTWEGDSQRVYEIVATSAIDFIQISNPKSEYELYKNGDGDFLIYYKDENGERQVYYPDAAVRDAAFAYSDLYATETFGTVGIPRLFYLRQALSSLYFGERVCLSDLSEGERALFLEDCGFNKTTLSTVRFRYTVTEGEGDDARKTEKFHTFQIADQTVNGVGYYVRLIDSEQTKEYVYATSTTGLQYAMVDFSYYINATLVAKGLKMDTVYEPYLTTAYRQWKNTVHQEAGTQVADLSKVIASAEQFYPASASEGGGTDGYRRLTRQSVDFALSELAGHAQYAPLCQYLRSCKIGMFSAPAYVTLTSAYKPVAIPEEGSVTYTYRIQAIEGIVTDTTEITQAGSAVGTAARIRVAYTYAAGNAPMSGLTHAVLDLGAAGLPAAAQSALRAGVIGDTDITFSVAYRRSDAVSHSIRVVADDIIAVYNASHQSVSAITEDCTVTYRYHFVIDGEAQQQTYSETVRLSEAKESFRTALIGKSVGRGQNILLATYTDYEEIMRDFLTYVLYGIEYFVTSEPIVAFRFANASERDPYYGESIYKSTMNWKNNLYGLNDDMCQSVIKFLGGAADDSTRSLGLSGTKTVAVGLTPAVLQRYGLYAYTIYFELPRGIVVRDAGSPDTDETDPDRYVKDLDDYDYHDTLGVTLYISERNKDGTRYIASDLYDLVALIDGSSFAFLEKDYLDAWARRILILTNVESIESVTFDLTMEDVYGTYRFDLNHVYHYFLADGTVSSTPPDDGTAYTIYDQIRLLLTPSGACSDSVFLRYYRDKGESGAASLVAFFNELNGGSIAAVGNDYAGTSYFKEILKMMYLTHYTGRLTEAQQTEALANAPLLMRMQLKMTSSALPYVFEFYRCADRQVMVRLYQGESTPVCDFYISTFAFKKVAGGIVDLLNGKEVSGEKVYTD